MTSPGDGFTTMLFGKHKGKPLSEVPKDYLEWVWEHVDLDEWPQGFKAAVKAEIQTGWGGKNMKWTSPQ